MKPNQILPQMPRWFATYPYILGILIGLLIVPSAQAQLILGKGALLGAGWADEQTIWAWSDTGIRLYDLQLQEIAFLEFENLHMVSWQGAQFLTQSEDLILTLWAYADGRAQKIWFKELPAPLSAMAWNGTRVALAWETQVEIWETLGDTPPMVLQHEAITALALEGNYLASGDASGQVTIWDSANPVTQFQAHSAPVTALSWGDNLKLATGSQTGEIKFWEGFSARLVQTLGEGTSPVNDLAWHNNYLVSATGYNFEGSEVRIWFARTGETVRWFGANAAMTVSVWNPSGDILLAAGEDNLLRLWDAEGKALGTITDYMDGVEAVAWSPTGQEIASAHDDGLIRLWDAETGALTGILQGHTRGVNAVEWNEDGLLLASASWDNTVRVWVRQSGKTRHIYREHDERVWAVAWGGRLIASASRDETVRVWNALTGETLFILRGAESDLLDVAWRGQLISASSDDGTGFIWSATSGELLHQLEGQPKYTFSLAWSPAQDQILTASWFDGSLRFWDAATGERLIDLNSARVYSLAWHPTDANRLVTGDDKGVIRIWDLAQGVAVDSLSKHQGTIYDLAWSPDGTRLASGGSDGRLIIWNE